MIIGRTARPHICLRCRLVLEKRRLPWYAQTVKISDEASRNSKEIAKDQKTPKNAKPHQKNYRNGGHDIHSIHRVQGKHGKSTKIIVLRERFQKKPETELEHLIPEYETPIKEVPNESVPNEGVPNEGVPNEGVPNEGAPNNGTPIDDAPRDGIPTVGSPFDLMDQLENEKFPVDTSEVNRHIESLRPEEKQMDSWAQFNQLLADLTEGFTYYQLQQYIESFKSDTMAEHIQDSVKCNSKEFLSNITTWQPGISSCQDYFDNDPTRGYMFESRTIKQRTAICLMRYCWDIELLILAEGIGQFEIVIRNDILELLLSGKPSHLQKFHDDVLIMQDEALEVFRSRNVIRITTTKTRKYRILQEIEKLVGLINIRIIPLSDLKSVSDVKQQTKSKLDEWTVNTFNDRTLTELKRMTGVTIRREAHSKICIGALSKKSKFEENPVDAARRLILTARTTASLSDYSLASADRSLAAPLLYSQLESLNWWCKLRSWFRWTYPISKETEKSRTVPTTETSAIHYINPPDGRKLRESDLKLLKSSALTDETASKSQWSSKFSTSTFASMGAVIHANTDPQSKETPSIDSDPKHFITDFSTHVPNITRLLSHAKIKKTRKYDEKIVLRFLPNPFSKLKSDSSNFKSVSAKILSALPEVEFHCSIGRDKKASFGHAEAIVLENWTDVMLPQETVDVRFHQRTTCQLLNAKLPSIRKFFQDCSLSTEPGGKLYAPPSINLPISSHICRGRDLQKFQNTQNTGDEDANFTDLLNQSFEYLFSRFEIRRRLVFKYEDWHLEYIYIDAGKSGGTRGELILRPIKNEKGVNDQEFTDFSFELACHLTSLSTPDMTRFYDFTRVKSSLVRKYAPVHQSTSDYPRFFMYIPKRIPFDPLPDQVITNEDSNLDLFPDFEEEIRAYEDEIDGTSYDEDSYPVDELYNPVLVQNEGLNSAEQSPEIKEKDS
ncbi:hypothetical protein GcC1_116012 [Golovinomyces cichoracearum]|uniref:Uncharacterized protein n=1 Tax=Golovinomyces cichoracearum TaxID=62708 RepID=A0A420I7Y9_9PEZI|nr:hypothetical protein GcC1_116012 [Golovinomyces cichoracearum]